MRDESIPASLGMIGLGLMFATVAYVAGSTPFHERSFKNTDIYMDPPTRRGTAPPRDNEHNRVTSPAGMTAILFGAACLAGLCSLVSLGAGVFHLSTHLLASDGLEEDEKNGRPYVPVSPSLWGHRGMRLFLVSPACPSPASARRTAPGWSAFAIAYHLVGIPTLALSPFSWTFTLAFTLGGSMLLGGTIPRVRYYLADRKVALEILDWTREARAGESVRLRCRVAARRPLALRTVRLTLACFEHTLKTGRFRSRCLGMKDVPLTHPERLREGESFEIEGTIALPLDAPLSFRGLPTRVSWTLGVVVDLPGWPDLEEIREVFVRPP